MGNERGRVGECCTTLPALRFKCEVNIWVYVGAEQFQLVSTVMFNSEVNGEGDVLSKKVLI